MNTTNTIVRDSAIDVANTIRSQIGIGAFMTLGASDLHTTVNSTTGDCGLQFVARILPMSSTTGKRLSRHALMTVTVLHNTMGYYDVDVSYVRRGEVVNHYQAHNVDAFKLSRLMVALDYDGPEVLNPRLF